jgi:hypothetical protein
MIIGMERRNAAIFTHRGLKRDEDRLDRGMDALTLFEETSYVVSVGYSGHRGLRRRGMRDE